MTDHREAVARIVDPICFRAWQALYEYCLPQDGDETARLYADRTHKAECDKALAKADDIIALLRPASGSVEGVGDPWTVTVPACPVKDETARILAMLSEGGGTGELGRAAVAGIDTIWGCCDPDQPEQSEQIDRARGNIVVALRAAVAGITLNAGEPPHGY